MENQSRAIKILPDAGMVLAGLHRSGFQAYVVGGCVRDALLGMTPHDWDICTDARPDQVQRIFGKNHCIPTGIQHGTVTVHAGASFLEVTTFRTESGYSDGRHPDSVSFIRDVREDLARRDFTVNAMAYNDEEGLIDPFGGMVDLLNHRVIRAVGIPAERFHEDALRIMRLYRFAARLEFAIDPATEKAALELAPALCHVSAERIREELVKTILTRVPSRYLPKVILREILPELAADGDADFRAVMALLDASPAGQSQRLAALFSRLSGEGSPEEKARRVLRRLRFSNEETDAVTGLVRHLAEEPASGGLPQRVQARRLLGDLGLEGAENLIGLWAAKRTCAGRTDAADGPDRVGELDALIRQMAASRECVSLKQLAIGGRDLMQEYPQARGPVLGRTLNRLLDDVICERVPNRREALLEEAGKILSVPQPPA